MRRIAKPGTDTSQQYKQLEAKFKALEDSIKSQQNKEVKKSAASALLCGTSKKTDATPLFCSHPEHQWNDSHETKDCKRSQYEKEGKTWPPPRTEGRGRGNRGGNSDDKRSSGRGAPQPASNSKFKRREDARPKDQGGSKQHQGSYDRSRTDDQLLKAVKAAITTVSKEESTSDKSVFYAGPTH